MLIQQILRRAATCLLPKASKTALGCLVSGTDRISPGTRLPKAEPSSSLTSDRHLAPQSKASAGKPRRGRRQRRAPISAACVTDRCQGRQVPALAFLFQALDMDSIPSTDFRQVNEPQYCPWYRRPFSPRGRRTPRAQSTSACCQK